MKTSKKRGWKKFFQPRFFNLPIKKVPAQRQALL